MFKNSSERNRVALSLFIFMGFIAIALGCQAVEPSSTAPSNSSETEIYYDLIDVQKEILKADDCQFTYHLNHRPAFLYFNNQETTLVTIDSNGAWFEGDGVIADPTQPELFLPEIPGIGIGPDSKSPRLLTAEALMPPVNYTFFPDGSSPIASQERVRIHIAMRNPYTPPKNIDFYRPGCHTSTPQSYLALPEAA